ncbi:adhesion G-protein coupled receptor G6-like [Lineus longissimus]|uniref:adhesion G-protein coupled receptor G6-like n=1 Tax=Lineus longissimus TaxID=88925 RepID=UPI00315C891A
MLKAIILACVVYRILADKEGARRMLACEGTSGTLTCRADRPININYANYGRTNSTICSRGRPFERISNTNCSSEAISLTIVKKKCHGKPECSISASNSIFGEPCFSTYKYLYVNYTCEIPEKCPETFMSTLKGNFTWPERHLWQTANVACKPMTPFVGVGSRECLIDPVTSRVVWGTPNLDACQSTGTPLKLEDLANVTMISQDNVITVTERLAENSNKTSSFEDVSLNADIIDNVLSSKMAFGSDITQNKTVVNLAETIGNIMNTSAATLAKSEEVGSAVTRLVRQVETISKSLELFGSGIKTFVNPKLAFAVVNSSQATRGDISMVLHQSEMDDHLTTDKVSIQVGGVINRTEVNTFLTIPQELALQFQNEKMTFALYQGATLFRIIDRAAQQETSTNSRVIVANIGDRVIKNLTSPIVFNLDYISGKDHSNPQCVFWDFASAEWSGAGCRVVTVRSKGVSCKCDHLTSFALLVDLTGNVGRLDPTHKLIQSILTYVGCALSLLALLFTVLTHFLFKKELLQKYPPKILMNLCFSMIAVNLLFICSSHYASDGVLCKVFAMFLHYFILASFCWMTVEAFFMCMVVTVDYRRHWTKLIQKFAVFGWGFPVIPVVITLGISLDNYGIQGHEGMCWLRHIPLFAAFVAPICLMLVFNFIVFGIVIYKAYRQREFIIRSNKAKENKSIRTQLCGAASLVSLLGLTWTFGLLNVNEVAIVFSYLFIVFNTLQGVFVFVFFCLLKKKATAAWAKKCGRKSSDRSTRTSSNSEEKYSKFQTTSLSDAKC